MRMITTAAAMQRWARRWKRDGTMVALVPTMGYLHAGHLSLIARARAAVGPRGTVGVSIYVNPTQFAPTEDLARYPRNLPRDRRLCRAAGADWIFHPADGQMYPGRPPEGYSTYVVEEQLAHGMEGAARPTHFRGVTTVVAKLFNLTLPDVAVFGAKDYQQAAVVQRMVRDLNFPVRVVVAPTVREPDGLAMSSRNQYLSPDQRRQAPVLWQALQAARQRVRQAQGPVPARELTRLVQRLLRTSPAARLDYVAVFDPHTFTPLKHVTRGAHMALAVRVGPTRLIDNLRLA